MRNHSATIQGLKNKVIDDKNRMPQIVAIRELLIIFKIKHEFSKSVRTVVYKSKEARYYNTTHDGKVGYKLIIETIGEPIIMNTSDPLYSLNSRGHAIRIISLLQARNLI